MKKALLILFLIIVLLIAAVLIWINPEKPPASQAFISGKILTMNANNDVVEAVLVENERIVAVGSNAEIKASITDNTLIHELNGLTLIPGIVDAHGHFPMSGFNAVGADLNSPPIGNTKDIKQMISALQTMAVDTEKGEWVFGLGYDDTQLAELRHPNRQELDQVSQEHPVFVLHISGHMGVANSVALQELGFNADSPNPEGGVIVKNPDGQLNGLLQETAIDTAMIHIQNISMLETLEVVKAAAEDYASKGVTTAQNGFADKKLINNLSYVSKLNLIPQRLEVWPSYKDNSESILSGEFQADKYNTERFKIGALKIIADGSIQGYTGFLSQPYHVQPDSIEYTSKNTNEEGAYVGYPTISREDLTKLVVSHFAVGTKLAIHGNGDAAIDNILHAVEQAQNQYPNSDARTIIIHAQMARMDQLDKMRELGITPSFFVAHTYYWGDRHRDIFMGPERAFEMSPLRSSLSKGVPFSIHLDTPVVPMDPMLLVWTAVNRQSSSGKIIGAGQTVSPMQALRATTIDAAWQIFREDEIGSIEVGKLADLVVLDSDPLDSKVSIKDIKVEQTFVGGVRIFDRSE